MNPPVLKYYDWQSFVIRPNWSGPDDEMRLLHSLDKGTSEVEENRRLNGEEYFYAFHVFFEHFFGRKWCKKESQEQGHWHHSSPSLGKNLSEEGRPHVCKKEEKSRKSWEILGAFPRSEISPPAGATTKYYYHYHYVRE